MNEVVHTSPTIGSNVETIKWKNINFVMWDIGGQESLRQSWSTYFINTEFIIFVLDSSDKERLSLSKGEFHKILTNEDLKKAAILIFANKQDIKSSLSVADISKFLNLTSLKNHAWHIQACCALSGEGLYQGLEWLSNKVKNQEVS
ncbi:unnamed protein product [Gordionus sp. m RMFG-2023]